MKILITAEIFLLLYGIAEKKTTLINETKPGFVMASIKGYRTLLPSNSFKRWRVEGHFE
jgi:hypothetical protein